MESAPGERRYAPGRGHEPYRRGMLAVSWEDLRLFLHVLAATVWVGGQLVLVGLLPTLRRLGPEVPGAVAGAFNRVAWPAFGLLIATGVWNIQATHAAQATGPYRVTLLVKLALVASSGLAAAVHIRASSRRARALSGAIAGATAVLAVLLGVQLAG